MAPSPRELIDRFTKSRFACDVVGPRVLRPVTAWYQENLAPDAADDAATATTTAAPTGGDGPSTLTRDPGTGHDPSTDHDHDPGTDHDRDRDHATVEDAARPESARSLSAAQAAEAFLDGEGAQEPPMLARSTRPPVVVRDVDPPPAGGFAGAVRIAKQVNARIKDHNLNVVAAGIAFWGLLAIPAILTAIVSIYGLVASPADVERQINDAMSGASEEARTIIGDQLSAVAGGSGGGLAAGAVVGIVLALWTSSGAIAKPIHTLNTIWGVTEDRPFPKLRGLAVTITLGAVVFVASAAFALAALPAVLDRAGLGDAARWLLNIGRFPTMLLVMTGGLSLLYWAGPNLRRRFRPLTWGAFIASLSWLVISGLFTIYTSTFASYNETYGSLGAIVVLLLWLFITAFTVLLGAEIDAARDLDRADAT